MGFCDNSWSRLVELPHLLDLEPGVHLGTPQAGLLPLAAVILTCGSAVVLESELGGKEVQQQGRGWGPVSHMSAQLCAKLDVSHMSVQLCAKLMWL